ncbi:hypothetical protein GGI02_005186 [Coemansia sp. RSA 2322]|uniref:Uncharacterized protein n=1 Tax=Coemansia thaxteri TaxID=2663907 RepID=A0A9W8EG05_9FUNG|nr:hypothetical protein H4R26_002045 [Coemansia thaxteri]KAJ2463678.1 hypothetical protein GGI02_005186 [Coemansia sp. RSA 2322]KAJ2486792.1 hypothetical protein EV174_000896 [Coemansia sp. RSA 2320]
METHSGPPPGDLAGPGPPRRGPDDDGEAGERAELLRCLMVALQIERRNGTPARVAMMESLISGESQGRQVAALIEDARQTHAAWAVAEEEARDLETELESRCLELAHERARAARTMAEMEEQIMARRAALKEKKRATAARMEAKAAAARAFEAEVGKESATRGF